MRIWQALSRPLRGADVILRAARKSSKSKVQCRGCGQEWSWKDGGIAGKAVVGQHHHFADGSSDLPKLCAMHCLPWKRMPRNVDRPIPQWMMRSAPWSTLSTYCWEQRPAQWTDLSKSQRAAGMAECPMAKHGCWREPDCNARRRS